MAVKKIRLILDTNWYISATINESSRKLLYELLTNENIIILYSNEILEEYQKVITREKFKKFIRIEQVTRFMDLVISKIENVAIKTDTKGSRDPDDNFLLSLSIDSNADYLVTGNMDLLVLKNIGLTQILTLSSFLKIISLS